MKVKTLLNNNKMEVRKNYMANNYKMYIHVHITYIAFLYYIKNKIDELGKKGFL